MSREKSLKDVPNIVILCRRKEGPLEECPSRASCLFDNRGQIPLTWGFPSSAIASVRAFQHDESPYDFFSEECPPQSPTIMAQYQKGLKNILQKHPNDVVFLSAFRTPITRSYKGGLRNSYPEQMLAAVRSTFFPFLLVSYSSTARSSVQRSPRTPTSHPPPSKMSPLEPFSPNSAAPKLPAWP